MPLSPLDAVLLDDMRGAALAAQNFVSGLDLDSYRISDLYSSAVERKLIVIGEAAGSVSDEIRRRYSDAQWGDITDFRNKLVHDYFDVDHERVWLILDQDLPALLQVIDLIFADES
jgi:uncharacterized protein with HEPN domain